MKIKILLICGAVFLCGCGAMRDPGFWGAMNQGTQQFNQQQQAQQQQWNQQFMQAQQQRLDQQRAAQQQQQNSGSPAYNSYNNTYQYVPPGWHKVWDENTHTWIIQP